MSRKVSIFLLLIFLACNKEYDNSNLNIFRYNESSGITTLDPIYSSNQANIWAVNQLFNGLVQLDKSLKIQPCIAKSWEISNNAREYIFKLRNDINFHNHKEFNNGFSRVVNAFDVEYSYNRLLDKKLASPGSWVLSNVQNFSALNDSTFKIVLIKPFPAFLSLLTMQYCSIVPKEIVELGDFDKNPIGTGPFKFQIWKDGVKMVFRKNNFYFEKDSVRYLPYLDAISITFIKDKQTEFLEFIKGNLDFISGIDVSYKDLLLTKKGNLQTKYKNIVKLQSKPYLNTEYLGFLMHKPLPIKIRKAINYGFDRSKMIKYIRNNIGTPAINGFVPLSISPHHIRLNGYNYKPEYAKKLIVQSVKEDNFDLDREIVLYTTSSYQDLCEYIQSELSKLGLNINMEVNPPSTHRQMVATSKINFFRGSWIADYPDAENYLSLFYSKNFSPNGPNYTHFNNKEFDYLYENSLSIIDDKKRYLNYHKMDSIIIDNAVIVPLYYDMVLRFSNKNINNFDCNPMNLLDLKRVIK